MSFQFSAPSLRWWISLVTFWIGYLLQSRKQKSSMALEYWREENRPQLWKTNSSCQDRFKWTEYGRLPISCQGLWFYYKKRTNWASLLKLALWRRKSSYLGKDKFIKFGNKLLKMFTFRSNFWRNLNELLTTIGKNSIIISLAVCTRYIWPNLKAFLFNNSIFFLLYQQQRTVNEKVKEAGHPRSLLVMSLPVSGSCLTFCQIYSIKNPPKCPSRKIRTKNDSSSS